MDKGQNLVWVFHGDIFESARGVIFVILPESFRLRGCASHAALVGRAKVSENRPTSWMVWRTSHVMFPSNIWCRLTQRLMNSWNSSREQPTRQLGMAFGKELYQFRTYLLNCATEKLLKIQPEPLVYKCNIAKPCHGPAALQWGNGV